MALKDELAEANSRIAKLEERMGRSERFQSWLMGAIALAGAIITLLADGIRKRLGFS